MTTIINQPPIVDISSLNIKWPSERTITVKISSTDKGNVVNLAENLNPSLDDIVINGI